METLLSRLGAAKTAVYEAILRTDRALYVQKESQHRAYEDCPLGIGYNATISAPHMHLFACQALHDNITNSSNDSVKVLDVGSGSGYLVAAFYRLLRITLGDSKEYAVVGVEHVDALVNQSKINLNRDLPDEFTRGTVKVYQGDGRRGRQDEAPFDFIHIGAACHDGVPPDLQSQLRVGGVIVLPVSRGAHGDAYQLMKVLRKQPDGFLRSIADPLPVAFVPLTDLTSQLNDGPF